MDDYSEYELKDFLVRYYELRDNPGAHEKTLSYLMQPHEIIFLYSLILKEQPDVIFESGTAVGWSASWMALASKAPVYTYDPKFRFPLFVSKKRQFNSFITKFTTARFRLHEWKGFKKLFFIDGDHSIKGFWEDFKTIEPFLETKDIIVLHDTIGERGVCAGLKRIKKYYPDWGYEAIKTHNGMEVITIK